MDISGVQIGPDVRLLVPEDASQPRLYHRVADDKWCETKIPKGHLRGSFESGDLGSSKRLVCSGKHIAGDIADGQWRGGPVNG